MRNKNRRSIGHILIDLTPLLDVVFILLFVVIASTSISSKNDIAKLKEREAQLEEWGKQLDGRETELARQEDESNTRVETMFDSFEDFNNVLDFVCLVEINEYVNATDRSQRKIFVKFMQDGDVTSQPSEYELNKNNLRESFEQIKSDVLQVKEVDKPILVKIKYENMLYRDEKAIEELFKEIDGVYLKPYKEIAKE